MKRALLLGAAVMALSGVSACGLTGDLKRPAPLWGEGNNTAEPAQLPDSNRSQLPQLPERDEAGDETMPPDPEDELLGGVGGSL